MNTPTPVEKKRACDADMLFHAGAGTGKTHALVSKYVSELLRHGDEGYTRVDQLVAITFTEKAAAEMKQRVRDRLTGKIEKLRRAAKVEVSTANLPEDAPGWGEKEKALAHLVRQRQALQGAYISTIHSFCARLLRENPIAAGVDPAFSVMDEMDAAELLEKTAVNTVLRLLRDGHGGAARLTRDLGFKSPGLVNHIVDMIPLVRAANKTPLTLLSDYERFLGTLDNADAEAARKELSALIPEMRKARKNTRIFKLTETMNERPELFESPDPSLAHAVELHKLSASLKSAAGGEEAGELLARMAAPALEWEAAANTRAFLEVMEEVIRDYSRVKDKKSLLDYDDLQEKARDLLRKDPETGRILSGKFRRALVDEFQDINDLQQEIIALLAPPGSGRLFVVGDVKQSIYGFRGADVTVFGKVAEMIRSSGGREYSLTKNFRSTPGLIRFTNGFFPALMKGSGPEDARFDPERDSLRPRFRDDGPERPVTRLSFNIDNGRAEDYRALEAATIASFVAKDIASGGIMVRHANGSGVRPAGLGDVALLLRKFTNLHLYENAFRFAGVPFQVARGKGFYHAQEIRDFISLLKALDYSRDRLALMSVLRSPLAGLSDAAILRIVRGEDGATRKAPEDFILKKKTPPGLDKEDREKLKTFAEMFRRWKKTRDRMMISELLETVLAETGYGAVMIGRFHGEQRLANLFKLIEMARRFESDEGKGLKNFIQRLSRMEGEDISREAQAEINAGGDAVTIMTTHQSKGLEFPIVIVGDLGAGETAGGGRTAFHHSAGIGMKVHDPESGEWAAGPMFEKVRAAENAAGEAELARLLYVAMTRAKDRLILSGSSGRKGKWEKWVDDIIAEAGLEVEAIEAAACTASPETARREAPLEAEAIAKRRPPSPAAAKKRKPSRPEIKITATGLATLRRCPRLYYYQGVMKLPPSRPGAVYPAGLAPETSPVSLGSRIHTLLEKAPLGLGAPEDALEKAVAEEFSGLDVEGREEILHSLERAFSSPPLSELSSTPQEAILREIPMALRLVGPGMTVTVAGAADIAWFNGEEWRVADYKYSEKPADEPRYILQLKLYAYTLMERMGMDTLDLALVYLKEKESPVSPIRVMRADLKGIRKTILDAASLIARLDGKPESEWMTIDEAFCEAGRCPYIERCHSR
ncbi:MAG: UvrD-helicase domain-containing protein [Candidatus Nitrospinota bacterium M3_3B_026]